MTPANLLQPGTKPGTKEDFEYATAFSAQDMVRTGAVDIDKEAGFSLLPPASTPSGTPTITVSGHAPLSDIQEEDNRGRGASACPSPMASPVSSRMSSAVSTPSTRTPSYPPSSRSSAAASPVILSNRERASDADVKIHFDTTANTQKAGESNLERYQKLVAARRRICIEETLLEKQEDKTSIKSFLQSLREKNAKAVKEFLEAIKVKNKDIIADYVDYLDPRTGLTPLHIAALLEDHATVTVLLEYGAKPCVRDNAGFTPATYALFSRSTVSLKCLLNHAVVKANINDPAVEGKNLLHMASHLQARTMTDLLLARGADVNSVSIEGLTPLQYACLNHSLSNIKCLLDSPAIALSKHSNESLEPIEILQSWHTAQGKEAIECMQQKICHLTKDLWLAILCMYVKISPEGLPDDSEAFDSSSSVLPDLKSIEEVLAAHQEKPSTPLTAASAGSNQAKGGENAHSMLDLKEGHDRPQTLSSFTPAFSAVRGGGQPKLHPNVRVFALLQQGADPALTNSNGMTALHLVGLCGNKELVSAITDEYSFLLSMPCNRGMVAVDYSTLNRDKSVTLHLVARGVLQGNFEEEYMSIPAEPLRENDGRMFFSGIQCLRKNSVQASEADPNEKSGEPRGLRRKPVPTKQSVKKTLFA